MKSNREVGDAYERDVARRLGGKLVKGSGSTPFEKEDIDFPCLRMQAKFTSGKSIALKGADFVDLEENALNCSKVPALILRVDSVNQEWVAFPLWMIKKLPWFQDLIIEHA